MAASGLSAAPGAPVELWEGEPAAPPCSTWSPRGCCFKPVWVWASFSAGRGVSTLGVLGSASARAVVENARVWLDVDCLLDFLEGREGSGEALP